MMKTDGPMITHLLAGHARAHRRDRDAVLEAALGVCGKRDPSVAYLGAASGDNPIFFRWMKSALLSAGAGRVTHVKLAGKKSDAGRAKSLLEEADIVHVGGGDVEAGMRALADCGLVDYLRGLHSSGKPVFGLSAGSIMLARSWVRWRDPDDDATAEVFPCLDLAPVYCDTHEEEAGFSELQALMALLPEEAVGYGIPSGAGLAVLAHGAVQALGGTVWRFGRRRGGVVRLDDLAPGTGA